ncbi:TerC family protein [Fluoribacter gormanii]|uniref:Integral membrane protein, YkoY family n=1 Tax=Fluoribacter gormanii TaxID=464 RepID=A0A377GIN6_9GAMM|nr:TerC family protein [Fluoribacter gormanii]KTD00300.1 putative transport protein [Fluoribacter gormanii]MCW8472195.1 TerC family protein [Fluoribacter gormanii]SIQ90361.1 Membrane protein TerC, possibly involved in tellurium resistance [Fluoribacter gormanii]STO24677.1 integral membrane protein, YkoY family [Fluoribacter gormanii]
MDFIDISVGLIVLIILEIVLGIDNLVILSILSEKLPPKQRKKARRWGLTLSWIMRLILLALAVDLIKLTKPLLTVADMSFSARDFFLMGGGAFLIWKATEEIHQDVTEEFVVTDEKTVTFKATFRAVIFQIALMDIIFSLDSVLTAVGLTSYFWVMAVAITCAILIMIFASEAVSAFIKEHPTIKMLALSYLILIGMVLVADGFSFHIPRGYIYFAMGFSLGVESLNLLKHSRKKRKHRSGN